MEQKYPTREQAQNISTSMCDHEDCDTCEIKRWCCYEDAGRECGASMVAMHDEINKLRELVREMRVCLNRNMPVTDRLWAESIELLGTAQKGRECDTCKNQKTMECPNSADCYSVIGHPHWVAR